jgi:hypothetical protein
MRDERESFADAQKRLAAMSVIPPSGEHQRFSVTDRSAKGASAVSDTVISEKTRTSLAVGSAIAIIASLIWFGMQLGTLGSERITTNETVKELSVRTTKLEEHYTETLLALGTIRQIQDQLLEQNKTLLRHSDALLWTHGKSKDPGKDDE